MCIYNFIFPRAKFLFNYFEEKWLQIYFTVLETTGWQHENKVWSLRGITMGEESLREN